MRVYKNIGKIKVISFDLDDTLYDNVPVINKAQDDFNNYLNDYYHTYIFNQNYNEQIRDSLYLKDPNLKDDVSKTKQEVIRTILKLHNFDCTDEIIDKHFAHFLNLRARVSVDERVIELLKKLREKYQLACISNGNMDINKTSLANCFDYNLRPVYKKYRAKPQSDLFLKLCSLSLCKASEILHVGDDVLTDIQGACFSSYNVAFIDGGYAKKTQDHRQLKTLPHLCLDNIFELSFLV